MIKISKLFKQIRSSIITGIVLLIPSVTTIYVFVKLFSLVDSLLPNIVHSLFPRIPQTWPPFVGFILILIISYFVGLAAKNYFGKMIIDTGNAIISRIPLLNKLYLGVQQIIDAIAGQKKNLFEKAVLIEYPKKNSYCIGFVTSKTTGEIPEKIDASMVSIFVPTTPNPTSGFLLFLPQTEVIELDMSIETAVKLVMSAGMVNTDHIKNTNPKYTLPEQLKNFNWLRIFKRKDSQSSSMPPIDPRD